MLSIPASFSLFFFLTKCTFQDHSSSLEIGDFGNLMPNDLVLIEQISTPPIFYIASFKRGGVWSQHMDAKTNTIFWYRGVSTELMNIE